MIAIAKMARVIFLVIGVPLTLQGVYNVLSIFGSASTVDTVANIVAAGMALTLACLCLMTAFAAQIVINGDDFA